MMEKYWVINHNADTTETGLRMNRTYVKTLWQGFPAQVSAEKEMVEDFCSHNFGDKVAYIQGVCPCIHWVVSESTKEEFQEATPIKWGGHATKTMRVELGIGGRGGIAIISETEA